MKQSQTWFLETSVHINRLFGHPLLKWEIKATIATQPCYTSFFVFYEFKRRVVKTLINLYCVIQEEESPAYALSYFMQASRSIRETKIVLGAISALLSQDDLRNDKRSSLDAIEILISDSLQDFYDSIAGFVTDQAKCPLAKASIDKGYEEFAKQIRCEAKCSIAQFWKENREILESVTQEDLTKPHLKNRAFNDMLPLLDKVLEDCQVGQTIRNCQKLADAIIAIEMPRKHTMLTFDRSFESLCPLMDKEVKRLPSLSALRQQSRDNQKQESL